MILNNKKKITLTTAVALFLVLCAAQFVLAANPPEPTYGNATVDGNYAEWNLANDFFANMYRAGDSDKVLESKLYIRYDVNTATVYVLVLTANAHPATTTPTGNAWAAINEISNKTYNDGNSETMNNNGVPPDLAWIYNSTYPQGSGYAIGYEASFKLNPGDYQLIVHLEVYNAATGKTETSATEDFHAGIDLFVVPEVAIGTTIVAILAAAGTFAVYKHKKQKN